MGSRSVDLTTQLYDPHGVIFHCTSVYVCSPIARVRGLIAAKIPDVPRHWASDFLQKTKAPHKRGSNNGPLRGWGAEDGPLSLE
jgi:hypothetical protein